MEEPIIKIENISKKYKINLKQGRYLTLRDNLIKIIKNPFSILEKKDEFWALKKINFSVDRGEAIGIIGANGAGKSTILKILSRITPPTEGKIEINGRVSSLLEVGTGFNPELSGRENIFLNGAILGMGKKEIENKMDKIIEFAGVEKFIDTPIKYYSSGMNVRLAFSIAAHLDPDILIVDEVLAVGDADFQKKCLGKMDEVVKKSGRTILFVSHNMMAVRSLCSKAVFLKNGEIVKTGEVNEVIEEYLNEKKDVLELNWNNQEKAPGNKLIKIKSAKIIPGDYGSKSGELYIDENFEIKFEMWNLQEDAKLNFNIILNTEENFTVFASSSEPKFFSEGLIKGTCCFPENLLNNQKYKLTFQIVQNESKIIYKIEDILFFEMKEKNRKGWMGKIPGIMRPKLTWI